MDIEQRYSSNIEAGLTKLEERIKEKTLLSAVAAMGRVIYDEVKLNTLPPRMGRKTGKLHEAIYRVYADDLSDLDTKVYRVSWNKKKAPHGHLLENGTSRMPAKPFIRPAADHLPEAVRAGTERVKELLAQGGSPEALLEAGLRDAG